MAPRTKPADDVLDGVNDDADDFAEVADERPWLVKSRDGRRVLFEGNEADARTYVQNHFPHVHAEPGNTYPDGIEPDVYVHSPDGVQHGYAGGEWDEYSDE